MDGGRLSMVMNTASVIGSSSAYKTTSVSFQYIYDTVLPRDLFSKTELTDAEMEKVRKTMSRHEESLTLLGL